MKWNRPARSLSRLLALPAALVVLCALLAACGDAPRENYDTAPAASAPAAAETYDYGEATGDGEAEPEGVSGDGPTLTQPADGRKVIMRANLSIETLDFTGTCAALEQAAAALGGNVAGTELYGGDNSSRRTASFTFKIPVDKYAEFLGKAGESGNVTSRTETSEDVTSQMVDIEARLESLHIQEKRLIGLMEESGSLEDLLTVQQKLTEVQYEIERYDAQKRTMNDLVAYSTVDITVSEVEEITVIPPETYGSRAAEAFFGSWNAVKTVIGDLGIALIWLLPVLLIGGAVAVVVVVIVRRAAKRRAANRPPLPGPAWQPPATPHASAPPPPAAGNQPPPPTQSGSPAGTTPPPDDKPEQPGT